MKALKPDFKRLLVPEGTYMARVFNIVYLGTQKSKTYGNESQKVRIGFELPTEKMVFKEGEPERPFSVSNEYTVSMGKKSNLRPVIESLIGVQFKDEEAYAFDIDDVMGKACQVTITHTEDGQYANISTVSPLLKGVICPPMINEPKILSFDKWDEGYFQKLPPFIKSKIEASKEFKKLIGLDVQEDIKQEDVPF